ncbi:MAG TPA: CBS domain-containing protein [Thermoanaerobaculia bacterium]|nr:CBS domain-containing protein [Thermoanaerobaculia bacterium]
MGQHAAKGSDDPGEVRRFTAALLRDLEALERLLDDPRMASPRLHAGAEQELFLVGAGGRPLPVAARVLSQLDSRFTSELALFNLEANLKPVPLGGDFLGEIEDRLRNAVQAVGIVARSYGAHPLLVGILPSLREEDLTLENMSEEPRYRALTRAALRLRGGRPFSIFIRGVEQFEATFDHPMPESANCSLQLHLQVAPSDFAVTYNLAQLITGPMLAAATASPLFCGRRLWHETRVALFERAIDSRTEGERARGLQPRVGFGSDWLQRSCLEVFRDNVARYRPMLVLEAPEDSMERLRSGEVPRLESLSLHGSTIWRWNRPCYGVTDGVPHVRIENRVLPSGPTVLDEVANAALFYGLLAELPRQIGDPASRLPFRSARSNLIDAARLGLEVPLAWLDGEKLDARKLLLERLVPAAADGLSRLEVPSEHVERYLGCIVERVSCGLTPSRWMLAALDDAEESSGGEGLLELTRRLLEVQKGVEPLHRQPISQLLAEAGMPDVGASAFSQTLGRWRNRPVEELMTGDLYTVAPEDAASLAFAVMDWRHVRHVPVEDHEGRPLGVLSERSWHRAMHLESSPSPASASEVMIKRVPQVEPGTRLRELAELLMSTASDCALVVSRGRMVGIVTSRDIVRAIASRGSS